MDAAIEARIAAPLSAHLATCGPRGPHVAPVWYVYEDDTLSVLTAGRKLQNVRENPRVAAAIERASGPDVEWMVAIQGTATVVEDSERIAAVDRRLGEKYRGENADADSGETGDADDEFEGALVEIAIGTATLQQY